MRSKQIASTYTTDASHEASCISGVVRLGAQSTVLKRAFDVMLSGLGLIVSAPVWGLIGVLIWLEEGRPIFIRQERVGKDGRYFFALKFRSMVRDSERTSVNEDLENDPRVTRVGRWLRATAIDELPQLWNIFVGDMSFVGPRALAPVIEDAERYRYRTVSEIPCFQIRSSVRPGLTGLAQVYAPRDIPRRHKFRYDLLYIKRQSLWLDLKLITLSFWITLRGKWECRQRKF